MRKPIVGISLKLYQNQIDEILPTLLLKKWVTRKRLNNSCVREWVCFIR